MKTVYADFNATSPLDPHHWARIWETLGQGELGNPSSQHQAGRNASVLLSTARRRVASALQAPVDSVVFVSGGTEANNVATAGVVWDRSHKVPIHEQHVVVSAIEHPSVLEPLFFLQRAYGLQITEVLPQSTGCLDPQDVFKAITPQTVLVAIMASNNETGALQPVKEVGDALHALRFSSTGPGWSELPLSSSLHPDLTPRHLQELHFHVDGVQSFGKVHPDLWRSQGQDSVTICAHKIGGLPGIGALSLKRGFTTRPVVFGGPQERNRRAGTESLVGVTSLSLLCEEMASPSWWEGWQQVDQRRSWLIDRIVSYYPDQQLRLNTPKSSSLPNTVSFCLRSPPQTSEDLLMELDMLGIYASSGSACSSGVRLPSRVLKALGRSDHEVLNGVRFSFGRQTSAQDVERIFQGLMTAFPVDSSLV